MIILTGGVLVYRNFKKTEGPPGEEIISMTKTLVGKKIAMVIALRDFRDAEYFVPKEILETTGVKITTISNKSGTAIGADGGEVKVDLTLSELETANFDAVIFIGGPGALRYLDNEDSYKVAQETISQGKLLAAICIAPVILAKARVLEGKKATVWTSVMDKSAVKILEDNEVIYQDKPVVIDGKIITGSGPTATKEFGEAIKGLLTSL